ncbi:pre-peptidase C-terminal domain-containing protein, partial [Desulforhopalus vacuolatus]|uniref:beta strand repeat-containing protein n=1 Tax=Desulforhopalus vacuolatus TaxID=40414 RepID=UPI001966994C
SDYNLSINTVAAVNDIVNGTTISGGDAGNSRTGATAVSLDSNGDTSITGYAGENDFYTFVAQHPGTATINLTGLSSDIDLRLLNSSGSRLDSSSSHSSYSGGSSSESISYNLISGETYYVKVDPFGNNTSDYNLSINSGNIDIINGTTVNGGDAGDSRTGAAAVSLDSNGDASITGYAGENDFYTFVAQHPGTATIDLTGLSSDIDLRLLSSSGSRLDSSSSHSSYSGGSSSESISYNLTSGETYYVKVDPFGNNNSDYNLSINTVAAVNDIVNGTTISGGDAGNSRTGATAVSLDSNGDASITGYAGDNDFYTFVAQNPGTATINLTGLSSDIDLRLLNSSGSRLDSSSSSGSSNESVSYNLISGETYYVKVDPFGINTSDYNLSINSGNIDIINGTTVSGGDAGDSRTGATAVSLDSNGDASITGYAGENDFYTFVAQHSGTATIDLTGLSSDIDLRLLSSSGSRLDSSSSDGSSNESVSYNLTSGETYYVKVDPYGNNTSDYNLSINTVAAVNDIVNGTTISGGDAGNSRTGATAVSLDSNGDTSITGYAGENDFYTFVAQHPGTATINLTGLSSDIDLRLLNSSGSRLDSSSSSGSSNESVSYNLISGETYYVKVDPFGNNTSDYNLSINSGNIDIINGTTVSGGDAGDSRTGATAVSLDSNGDASITGYAGENDFYTFVAQHPGTATIDLTGLSSDVDLRLLSSSGSRLDSSSSHSSYSGGSSSESISYNLTSGEIYYVKVDPFGNNTSDYNLSINTVAAVNDIVNGTTISGGDAGNSRTGATAVSLDSNGDASITGYVGDNDFYTFVAQNPGTATIDLTGLSSAIDLRLLNSSGSRLDSSSSNGSSSESVSYNLISGETYYVKVDPFGNNTSDYNLSINSGNIDIINGTTVSGGDAGDSRTGATAVSLDSNGDSSITGYAGENDFYTFVAQHPGTATIDLTGLSSDIDLRLLSSSGSRLDSSSSHSSYSSGSSSESISYNLTSGEIYYVKVDPYKSNTSDYNLSINTAPLFVFLDADINNDGNCETSVNNLFTVADIPENQRAELGEFDDVDLGEEIELSGVSFEGVEISL